MPQETDNPAPLPLRWVKIALALALLCTLFTLGNEIQEIDPAQYAEIAREMVESGDWLTLRDNYGPYLDKPPVTFWLIATSYSVFGINNFAYRLPTLLFALLTVFFVGRIGRILCGRETAWLAMLLTATSQAQLLMVADPKIDLILTGLLVMAFWAYFESRERPRLIYLAYVFTGLGVLTKGPIALCVPALAIGMEWLLQRDWKALWRLKPLQGLLIVVGIVLPWHLVLAQETGARGPLFLLLGQSFGRLVVRDYQNDFSPLFFVHTFFWAFLPWSLASLWAAWARLRTLRRDPPRAHHQPRRVLWWWFALPFVFISLSSYKLPQYLFWLLPPLSILIADFLARALGRAGSPGVKSLCWTQFGLSGLLVAAVAVFQLLCFPLSPAWLALSLLGVAMAFWVVSGFRAGTLGKLVVTPALAMIFLNSWFFLQVYPESLKYQYGGPAGRLIWQQDPDGRAIYSVGQEPSRALAFYAGRRVLPVALSDLRQVLCATPWVWVVTPASGRESLDSLEQEGYRIEVVGQFPSFRTSRPTSAFILEESRPKILDQVLLARVVKPDIR